MADAAGVEPLEDGDPTEVGSYTLSGRLGVGGMGSVYLGRSAEGRPVAIKVIRREFARDPDFRARFLSEVQAARRVARFCTAEVLDVDIERPEPYLVTEYVEGPTLAARVRQDGPLPPAELERLAVAVANALTAIHAANVIHRDLKPGNILLSPSGARVIDFGIARAMESATVHTLGRIVGTPAFMAPEQALGLELTPAADVYAWGGVMLYAATGRKPFGDAATPVVLYRVVHDEPDFTGLDDGLLPLVRQAMSKDPAARPNAHELLPRLVGGSAVQAGAARPVAPVALAAGALVAPASTPWTTARPEAERGTDDQPGAGYGLAGSSGDGVVGTAVVTNDQVPPAGVPTAATSSYPPAPGNPWSEPNRGAAGGRGRVSRPRGGSRDRRVAVPVAAAVAVVVALVGVVVALDPFGRRDGTKPTVTTSQSSDAVSQAGEVEQPASGGPAGSGPGAAESSGGARTQPAQPRDWLVFKRYDGDSSINDSPIVVVDPDGNQRQIGTGDSPALAPDGSRVAYATVDGQIVTVRPDGNDQRQLTNLSDRAAEYPAWSRDGTRIAYFHNTGGLYLMGTDGAGGRRLADVDGLEPSWSPDGGEIVFRDPDQQTLNVVSTVDGSVRVLTGTPRAGTIPVEPSWSPDGATILFGTAAGGIYAIAPDGTGLRELAGVHAWHPTWSPDGRVVFVRDAAVDRFFATRGPVESMKADGSDGRPVGSIIASGPVHWARE
ncbi:serine/threonine-protein kinase [Frankia sp. CNm7]|uniref:Serine/threonine-protein kinase n=1 Tax=Frankia nepalensis TaxID=1836974 RepID=A0A937US40_9ACTN|nr:protein kinase [Frankia nepalensis]MBL7499050.1 serine/threonine-protein kinase [Frankia nepalensis]MBL7515306.1 serine/threonine-protein kinase [Frankia nepalensis]MBL7520534.1 serine/threonine-protein kinase [Frankia nepalensis]MBL7632042.1 serine/threonine-protein kinase [Frankia nepalensis]